MFSLFESLFPGKTLSANCDCKKVAGTRVMLGTNNGPVYKVIHIHEDTAWIRPLSYGEDALVPLDRLRSIEDDCV